MSMKKGIYIVSWTDAAGLQNTQKEWLTIEEAKEIAEEKWGRKNVNTGFILYKDKRFIIIAGSQADDDLYSDMSMIPVENIVSIKKVK